VKVLLVKVCFFLLILCPLFVGCARQTIILEDDVSDSKIATLQARAVALKEWNMQMRIALKHKDLSWRGTMQWQQSDDSFSIIFSDRIGRRLLLIESLDDGSVSAVDAKGYRRQAANASLLIKSILAVEVPLDNLHYWLSGAPAPVVSYNQLEFNRQGLLESYEQDGWAIRYADYRQDDCANELPSHITLSDRQTQLWLQIRSRQLTQNAIKTSIC